MHLLLKSIVKALGQRDAALVISLKSPSYLVKGAPGRRSKRFLAERMIVKECHELGYVTSRLSSNATLEILIAHIH